MVSSSSALLVAAALCAAGAQAQNSTCAGGSKPLSSFKATLINGTEFSFAAWTGQVVIVTNVASF